eukprot:s1514_g20.t1
MAGFTIKALPICLVGYSQIRSLGATTTACNSDVKIYVTKDFKFFLGNTSGNDLRFSPGELLGFGLGSFAEKLAGLRSSPPRIPRLYDVNGMPGVGRSSGKDCIAWLLGTDADMVACAGNDGKKVLPLAEAGFYLAESHNGDGTPKDSRYTLSAKPKINCFTPKALEEKDTQDILNVRHTMFGALFTGNLSKLSDDENLTTPAPKRTRSPETCPEEKDEKKQESVAPPAPKKPKTTESVEEAGGDEEKKPAGSGGKPAMKRPASAKPVAKPKVQSGL